MTTPTEPATRLALLSVSDKTGLTDFARSLVSHGFTLLSTGGTARKLREAGLDVTDVSDHTGFPEIMDGRVKTLHPKIHGGLLGRVQDSGVMKEHGIDPIEIVAVNLYPFEAVTAKEDCSFEEAIENIDIGGPAMVRASAKNHDRVAIVTSPEDYGSIESELNEQGSISAATRKSLAAKAYAHTARYDGIVAAYLADVPADEALPSGISGHWQKDMDLRYGENPHQLAAFYSGSSNSEPFEQIQGKELSYNNIADADAAMECVAQFDASPACIIVKHANPCGGAEAGSIFEAYDRAHQTDPISAFGGIIAFNDALDETTAAEIIERQFVEVVIAPDYDEAALSAFEQKPNVRVLRGQAQHQPGRMNFHVVGNGLLVQQNDSALADRSQWLCVSDRQASDAEWDDLEFAWKMVRMVKSNAIVYAKDRRTLGIGAGQMSRVDSSRIAAWKAAEAELDLSGAAMASDAFFPFRDSVDAAAKAGIGAIIQPGGSMRDDEVIAAANEHGMAMIFTGIRHFRH